MTSFFLRNSTRSAKRGGLVARVLAPDRDDGRVIRMCCRGIGLDGLGVAKGRTAGVRPVGGRHPAVVAVHDRSVGAVVGRQLDRVAARHPLRELQDIPHRGSAETVEALVLVPDNTEVPVGLNELQEDLLLDVVGVLVLVHENVADVAGHSVRSAGVIE